MNKDAIIVERTFPASAARIWKALTNKEEMKKWYFDLEEFKPEVGFKFQFTGGSDEEHQYLHLCEITEVVENKKLSYSWRYDGYPGNSFVSFELFEQGDQTLLRLTHEGVETFVAAGTDFAKQRFEKGWSDIVHRSLKEYIDSFN
ncbi:MAG: SRPBCC domain-containing protein [Chitinophagales bacterium]